MGRNGNLHQGWIIEGQAEENFPFQSHSAMSRHRTSAQTQKSLCCERVKTRLEEEFFSF